MRNTDKPAGTVFTVSPSRTSTGRLCSAISRRPLGSIWKVRGWILCVSACWVGFGSPAGGLIDRVDDDAVFATLEDLLALKLDGLLGAVGPIKKTAVRMHMNRARPLPSPNVVGLRQCLCTERDLRVDSDVLHPIGVH